MKKQIGLVDTSLMQILLLLQITWIGTAAKLGTSHVLLWLPAILLFFIPSASVVIYLSRLMPFEGGLYQWTKLGFNDFVGFLVGWNYYISNIIFISTIGLEAATYFSYIIGPSASWIAASKWIIIIANCIVVGFLIVISVLGLGVGKWLHNAGGLFRLLLFLFLVALPFINLRKGSLTEYHPLKITMPALSLLSLNILGKMAFGAFSGFEEVAVFAGECRNAVRTIGKSVIIATPIVALLYLLATSSVVAFVPPEKVDLIGTVQQVLTLGLRPFGIETQTVPIISLVLLLLLTATSSVVFAQNARLPMAAGWDRLLPQWFTRLHEKYKTPVNSIIFSGVGALILSLVGLIGLGNQQAFQLLLNGSFIFWALTYLVMFALPIIGLRGVMPRPSLWVKLMAICGFLMTLLYIVFSVFPIIDVPSWLLFAAEIIGLIVVANAIGIFVFISSGKSRGGE